MIPLLIQGFLGAEHPLPLLALVYLESGRCAFKVAKTRVAEDDSLFDDGGEEGLVVRDDDEGAAGLLDEELFEPAEECVESDNAVTS